MTYSVVVTPEAEAGIRAAFLYIFERSPMNAERWLHGLYVEASRFARFLMLSRNTIETISGALSLHVHILSVRLPTEVLEMSRYVLVFGLVIAVMPMAVGQDRKNKKDDLEARIENVEKSLKQVKWDMSRVRIVSQDVLVGQGAAIDETKKDQFYVPNASQPYIDNATKAVTAEIPGLDPTEAIEGVWVTPVLPLDENVRFRLLKVDLAGPHSVTVRVSVQDAPPVSTGPDFNMRVTVYCLVKPLPKSDKSK